MPARGGGGFSLLEVIIALAVVGLGVGVIFGGIGQGLRLRRTAAADLPLAVVADSLVGGLLARTAAPEAPEEGEQDGVRWSIETLAPSAPTGGDTSLPPLVEVRIALEGAGGNRWELVTLLPREEERAR